MATLLNCEGESCPKPVLRCKHLLETENPTALQVIVDNEAAKENVVRFLGSRGLRIDEVLQNGHLWTVSASQTGEAPAPTEPARATNALKTLIFLTADRIGRGDDTLGSKLMENFLNTLPELGDTLWKIIMVNSGVKLSTAENPALPKLKELEAAGVSIMVCGACLEFFHLMEKKEIGQVTNMLDIVTSQQLADKIITI